MRQLPQATLSGIAYSLPLAVWLLPLVQGRGDWQEARLFLQEGALTILLLQALVSGLFLIRPPGTADWRAGILRSLLLIAPAWPLLTWIWLNGAVAALPLLLSQLTLAGTGLLLSRLARTLTRRPLLGGALQLLLAALLLNGYGYALGHL